MKKVLFFVVLVSGLTGSVENSYASKCKTPSLEDAFKSADLVFAGVIQRQTTEKISGTRMGVMQTTLKPVEYKFTYYQTSLSFIPVRIWKGEAHDKVLVFYNQDDARELVLDQKNIHLIFAKRTEGKEGEYTISECSPKSNLGLINSYFTTLLLDKMNKAAVTRIGNRNQKNTKVTSYPIDVPGFKPESRYEMERQEFINRHKNDGR